MMQMSSNKSQNDQNMAIGGPIWLFLVKFRQIFARFSTISFIQQHFPIFLILVGAPFQNTSKCSHFAGDF